MRWQSTPYAILLFLAAAVAVTWAVYGVVSVDRRERSTHATALIALCLAVAVWSFTYAIQLSSTGLDAKLLAYEALHLGAAAVPTAWFVFALAYTGRESWLTRRTLALLAVVPLALLAAFPTNPFALVLADVYVETSGGLRILVTDSGPLYQLFLASGYVLLSAGSALVAVHALGSNNRVRRQSAAVLVGAVVPLAVSLMDVFDVPPVGTVGVNLTPVSLAVSVFCFGVAVFGYRIFDLTPVARNVTFEHMHEGVVVVDDGGSVVDLNPAAESILGLSSAALGRPARDVVPGYDRVTADGAVDLPVTVAGVERVLRLTCSPLVDGRDPFGRVVMVHDVTVRERQRDELERQNERLDAFARIVSHDLRNPLNVIGGYAELARETGDPRYFDTVEDTVERVSDFLDDLLFLSRRGETITDRRPTSLAAVVEEANLGVDGDLAVTVLTDAEVDADRARLRQAFENLLRNAVEHGDATVVRVGDLPDGFFLEDDGAGVPAAERESVFESGVSGREAGTGFGLAIVRDVIEAHGWTVSLTGSANGGARFEVTGVERLTR